MSLLTDEETLRCTKDGKAGFIDIGEVKKAQQTKTLKAVAEWLGSIANPVEMAGFPTRFVISSCDVTDEDIAMLRESKMPGEG